MNNFVLIRLEYNSPEYQSKSFYDLSVENSQSKSIKCPENTHKCIKLLGQSESVCCPIMDDSHVAESQQPEIQERTQSSKFFKANKLEFIINFHSSI